MGATLRQQYFDPNTGRQEIKEIHVDIEMWRSDSSGDVASRMFLKVEQDSRHHNPNEPTTFTRVLVDPEELITTGIDGKRTTKPISCMRSYLTVKCPQNSSTLEVFDNSVHGLNAKPGDVLVLLSDLDGTQQCCVLVEAADGNHISISKGTSGTFFKGAFVQNLSNRWHKNTPLGAKSQLSRPQPVSFYPTEANVQTGIELMIATPVVYGSLKAYDVYVRDKPFDEIKPHWMPDAEDINVDEEQVIVTTFNGGPEAGGEHLVAGKYYLALISKDGFGRCNVNESVVHIRTVEVKPA